MAPEKKIQTIAFESLGARKEFRASLKENMEWGKMGGGREEELILRFDWVREVNCFGTAGSTENILYCTSSHSGVYIYHSLYVQILVCMKRSVGIMEMW
jgi:hypothetical protein